eukprot:COSAG01_NODE_35357_length_533_cov_0.790323_1_plen_39_part_01
MYGKGLESSVQRIFPWAGQNLTGLEMVSFGYNRLEGCIP